MDTALVIMAAGIGSRFGGGIKQLESVGPNGEIIMDYSIHDALEAGFNRVIFIIRHDIEALFNRMIGDRIRAVCAQRGVEMICAYQEKENLPGGFICPAERVKPWGTGHAVLCAKDVIGDAPFAVINSDDYYGKAAYKTIYEALCKAAEGADYDYCMVGYELGKTVTDNGYVARGVCTTDEKGNLLYIQERTHIEVQGDAIRYTEDGQNWIELAPETTVSMNMWGFIPSFLKELEEKFGTFMKTLAVENPEKAEKFVSTLIEQIKSDDDPRETRGYNMARALLENSLDGFLIALCGWGTKSLLNIAEFGSAHPEEEENNG